MSIVEVKGTTVEIVEPCAIIDGAIQDIKTYGWRQRTEGDEVMGFCPWGALKHQTRVQAAAATQDTGTPVDQFLSEREVTQKIVKPYIDPLLKGQGLVSFNDTEGRTKKEVLRLLRKAYHHCAGSPWWKRVIQRY